MEFKGKNIIEDAKKALGTLADRFNYRARGDDQIEIWVESNDYNITCIMIRSMEKAGFIPYMITLSNEKTTKDSLLPGMFKPMIIFIRKGSIMDIS